MILRARDPSTRYYLAERSTIYRLYVLFHTNENNFYHMVRQLTQYSAYIYLTSPCNEHLPIDYTMDPLRILLLNNVVLSLRTPSTGNTANMTVVFPTPAIRRPYPCPSFSFSVAVAIQYFVDVPLAGYHHRKPRPTVRDQRDFYDEHLFPSPGPLLRLRSGLCSPTLSTANHRFSFNHHHHHHLAFGLLGSLGFIAALVGWNRIPDDDVDMEWQYHKPILVDRAVWRPRHHHILVIVGLLHQR